MAKTDTTKPEITVRETETKQFGGDILNGQQQAVMLSASLQEGQSVNLHVQVLDPAYVVANQEGVASAVDAFIVKIRSLAAASGLPL